MTRAELTAIRDKCLSLASRHYRPEYVRTLRHVASDAQAALDGCNASLESVAEYIATDHEIEMARFPRAAESYVPARAA